MVQRPGRRKADWAPDKSKGYTVDEPVAVAHMAPGVELEARRTAAEEVFAVERRHKARLPFRAVAAVVAPRPGAEGTTWVGSMAPQDVPPGALAGQPVHSWDWAGMPAFPAQLGVVAPAAAVRRATRWCSSSALSLPALWRLHIKMDERTMNEDRGLEVWGKVLACLDVRLKTPLFGFAPGSRLALHPAAAEPLATDSSFDATRSENQ